MIRGPAMPGPGVIPEGGRFSGTMSDAACTQANRISTSVTFGSGGFDLDGAGKHFRSFLQGDQEQTLGIRGLYLVGVEPIAHSQ